jgi:hypothetical protein
MAHDLFISYSQHDKPAADRICELLEQAGIRCWIAPRDIASGVTWPTAIAEAIERCRVMLFLASPPATESRHTSRELQLADAHKVTIVPVRLNDFELTGDASYFLGNTQWFDAFPGSVDDHAGPLVSAVQALLSSQPQQPSPHHAAIQKQSFPVKKVLLGTAVVLVLLILVAAFRNNSTTPGAAPTESTRDAALTTRGQIPLTDVKAGTGFEKGFRLSPHPTTVGEYEAFIDAEKRTMPEAPHSNQGWQKKEKAMVRLKRKEAQQYCEWGGGRLPTLAELEYAKSDSTLGIGDDKYELMGATKAVEATNVLGTSSTDDNRLEQFPIKQVDKDQVGFRCVVDNR